MEYKIKIHHIVNLCGYRNRGLWPTTLKQEVHRWCMSEGIKYKKEWYKFSGRKNGMVKMVTLNASRKKPNFYNLSAIVFESKEDMVKFSLRWL